MFSAIEHEKQYVTDVYNEIAPHFSSTRFSLWPKVKEFIQNVPVGSIIGDIGMGNGKYMSANPLTRAISIGCDKSENLVSIARARARDHAIEGICADNISLPFRTHSLDYAISIAVIHHFASPERRLAAILEILRVLRVGGEALIYVWAFEQKGRFEGKFPEQDAMVPWTMPKRFQGKKNQVSEDGKDNVFFRYYHLFKQGELEELVSAVPGLGVVESGFDHQNWYIRFSKVPV